jgi:ABC-2 type transport system permease protein
MNAALYRTEIRRMTRTHTLVGMTLFFAFFGVSSPLLTYFLPELLRLAEGVEGVEPEMLDLMPEVTSEVALGSYVQNVQGLGVLFVLLVAAAALAVDGSPGRSTFYRVRVAGPGALVLPRFAVPAAAAAAAYTLGALAAWSTTLALVGAPPLGATLTGTGLSALFLVFAVAVAALAASAARGVLAAVGLSVAFLVLLVLLGQIPVVGRWVPTALFAAQSAVPAGAPAADFLPAALSALAGTVVCLLLAVRGFGAREV